MVWGGSINSKGSDYLRKLREINKVLKFLEEFKEDLNSNDKLIVNNTINIIVDYINRLSEGKS
ncbi:MAG: hypothetical protein ACFFBP_18770 [Promethearchaeota archaeon]